MGFTVYVCYQNDRGCNSFGCYCYSCYIVTSILISFSVMTEQCFVNKFKTEKKHAYNTPK